MNKSGCSLTWEHFTNKEKPWLVTYVEDRDLWAWKLENSEEINAAISSYELDFEVWDKLSALPLEEVINQGKAILRYKNKQVNELCKNARKVKINGYEIPIVNSASLQSEIGNKLSEGNPFACIWFQRQDGKFIYSLRSKEIDVSKIASKFLGGGHKLASGFTLDYLIGEK